MIKIHHLLDNAKCFETIHELRWPDGINCSHSDSTGITKQGRDDIQPENKRYACNACSR